MNKHSLRQQLVLPFVFLVIFVSAAIGWVSFRAGEHAVAELTRRVLVDMVSRIGAATEQHLQAALTVLQAVEPDPKTVPKIQPFTDNLKTLEERLWIASGLFMGVNNYVYFGGTDGRFVGVKRVNRDLVELSLRESGKGRRTVYSVQAPGDRSKILRSDGYDPRVRPWYRAAFEQAAPVWSSVYNDFTTREPTITLAKPVYRSDRSLAGVMATDVTLKTLTDFLRTLSVSKSGVAFLMDNDGYMIATSGDELPFKMVDGLPQRMLASEMKTGLIREAHAKVIEWQRNGENLRTPLARDLWGDSGIVEIGVARLGEKYGVNWLTVVVIPRSDFMGDVTRSLYQGIVIGGICVLLALMTGLILLNRVLRDIRALTNAAQQVGNGEPLPTLNIRRRDELGQLAQTFSEMEHNLRIDKLTAVFNRESLNAQVSFLHRQAAQMPPQAVTFALLFIDLDHFKSINDHYGHAAGDQTLVTVAARLKSAVRATDVVARYGGDEFVILLKGVTKLDDVIESSDKIREIVEEPIRLEHGTVRVGVSLGWAMFPEDGTDTKTLLKVADSRMFQTKKIRKAAR
ncbi:MAG TPA: diguanylate cyclase [Paucimonas sp.]|nr:diguanylate cyclase [Paucimonas sp.]